MEKVETVCLVSCVSAQREVPGPAKDLYQSDWFTKARRYVEAIGSPWFILSARHGLIGPDDVISPYEQTLNTMGVSARRAWADMVRDQMGKRMPNASHIVVLAGGRYREFLMNYLRRRSDAVDVPMLGLRGGEQSVWLGNHVGHGQAR